MAKKLLSIFIFSLFILLTVFQGCKSESDPITPQTEHFEPEGWIIRDATLKPILVVFQGVIQSTWNGISVDDTLIAPLNALSDHYSIKFLDGSGNIINPPYSTDYSFSYIITDTSKLSIVKDSPTDWAFHLKGKQEGITTIELQLSHLGHVDVRTPKIPVLIKQIEGTHGEATGLKIRVESTNELLVTATDTSCIGGLSLLRDSSTQHLKVVFFDENGTEFQPEYPLHTLEWSIDNPSIINILRDDEEPWVIRIQGKSVGTAYFRLKLVVGNIAEFISAQIQVTVN